MAAAQTSADDDLLKGLQKDLGGSLPNDDAAAGLGVRRVTEEYAAPTMTSEMAQRVA
jgi:hypothetical protein